MKIVILNVAAEDVFVVREDKSTDGRARYYLLARSNSVLEALKEIGKQAGFEIVVDKYPTDYLARAFLDGTIDPPPAEEEGRLIPDFETCIKQVVLHMHKQSQTYMEIAVDPKTKEIAWTFTPTPPPEDQLHSRS